MVPLAQLELPLDPITKKKLVKKIQLRKFNHTSSTTLEIQTALWALENRLLEAANHSQSITLFTDSKSLFELAQRRPKLEANQFCSKKTAEPLHNADLYRRYFSLTDQLELEVVKVKGHGPKGLRNDAETIFSLVDKQARKELRALDRALP